MTRGHRCDHSHWPIIGEYSVTITRFGKCEEKSEGKKKDFCHHCSNGTLQFQGILFMIDARNTRRILLALEHGYEYVGKIFLRSLEDVKFGEKNPVLKS